MKTLATLIQQATGTSPLECYQCGRCSAGCAQNVSVAMDLSPNRIMHLVQMEHACQERPQTAATYAARVLTSEAIWMCLSCHTCSQRCPQGLDISGTMDTLRQIALERHQISASPRVRRLVCAQQAFIRTVKRSGHTNESALVSDYKLHTGDLLTDTNIAPQMAIKGKLQPKDALAGALSLLRRQPSPALLPVLEAAERLEQNSRAARDDEDTKTTQKA